MDTPVVIANPIYDAVFKYLMDDLPVARVIISTIIGQEVEELEFKQRERSAQVASLGVTIFRLDFSAVIKTADGERKNVLIEIQKADNADDIARFRRYLAENYYTPPVKSSKTVSEMLDDKDSPGPASELDGTLDEISDKESGNAFREAQEKWPVSCLEASTRSNAPLLPILTIYILGFPLSSLHGYPGIIVRRDYYDAASGEKILKRDAFIEHLTHDSYVIQVSELKQRRRNKLERLLSFFEQMHLKANGHLKVFHDVLDEEFQIVLDRLARAALDKAIRDEMDAEDEFLELLKRKERSYAKNLKAARKELEESRVREEEALERADAERLQKEEAKVREEKALLREEEERRQKEEALSELAALKRKLKKMDK
ncbi:hypothetical protein [Desulfonatronovibrio magnus]|uniref:hypothetical protein n=1 Tax=Desulfonatronovibrio magnus TaxID=698827 RepID=UPI0005EB4E6E|nr:hypothetical protein [Desulfonatronovibrio magnus]RQD65470.1 MAG: hypothetical protein D5R98_03265 [Desulfonatronovibrio sp. MSAO_Bac4]